MTATGDVHALSGAYVVDAVDDIDRALFEQHLRECGVCRSEVDSLRETAALLVSAGTLAPPPPELRERVLDRISTVRPLPPVSPQLGPPVPASRRTPRSHVTAILSAAAAAAVIAGAGVAVWQPWQSWQEEPSQAPTRMLTAEERVRQAPDVREVALRLGEARATVVHSPALGEAVIVTESMPTAPEGRVYELWWETPDGGMEPAGIMPRAEDQSFVLEGDGSEATAVGITVEPAGGSPEPTSEPIALFEF